MKLHCKYPVDVSHGNYTNYHLKLSVEVTDGDCLVSIQHNY